MIHVTLLLRPGVTLRIKHHAERAPAMPFAVGGSRVTNGPIASVRRLTSRAQALYGRPLAPLSLLCTRSVPTTSVRTRLAIHLHTIIIRIIPLVVTQQLRSQLCFALLVILATHIGLARSL